MSSDGFTFEWGSYTHPKGEVYPKKIEYRPLITEYGVPWAMDIRLQVAGSFVNQNPELDNAGVNTRIAAMTTAYNTHYQDAKFYLPDGSLSENYLLTDDALSLSGNRVLHRSWDNIYPTELANTRSFTITIGARFLHHHDNIIYFHETTQRIGDGGPIWRLYNRWDNTPVQEDITLNSKVYHITKGTVIGIDDWPSPPPPLWPNEEQTWRRSIIQSSPKFHGDLTFQQRTHFAVNYAYYFERLGPDPTSSNLYYIP